MFLSDSEYWLLAFTSHCVGSSNYIYSLWHVQLTLPAGWICMPFFTIPGKGKDPHCVHLGASRCRTCAGPIPHKLGGHGIPPLSPTSLSGPPGLSAPRHLGQLPAQAPPCLFYLRGPCLAPSSSSHLLFSPLSLSSKTSPSSTAHLLFSQHRRRARHTFSVRACGSKWSKFVHPHATENTWFM